MDADRFAELRRTWVEDMDPGEAEAAFEEMLDTIEMLTLDRDGWKAKAGGEPTC